MFSREEKEWIDCSEKEAFEKIKKGMFIRVLNGDEVVKEAHLNSEGLIIFPFYYYKNSSILKWQYLGYR